MSNNSFLKTTEQFLKSLLKKKTSLKPNPFGYDLSIPFGALDTRQLREQVKLSRELHNNYVHWLMQELNACDVEMNALNDLSEYLSHYQCLEAPIIAKYLLAKLQTHTSYSNHIKDTYYKLKRNTWKEACKLIRRGIHKTFRIQ